MKFQLRSLPLIMILVLTVTCNVYLYTRQQTIESWWYTNQDHIRIATMYQSIQEPSTFPHDLLYQSPEYFKFYTPSFFTLLSMMPNGGDPFLRFANLALPQLLLYLPIAIIFFWVVCQNLDLSVIMAVVSTGGFAIYGEFWRINDLEHLLPRTMALSFILLAITGVLWQFRVERYRLLIPMLVGVCVGITANLHPTSGMGLAIVIFILYALSSMRNRQTSLIGIIGFTFTVLLTSLPVVFNTLGNSSFNTSVSSLTDGSKIWFILSKVTGREFLAIYPFVLLGWIVISILAWFLGRQRRMWQLIFCLLQLAYTCLAVDGFNVILATLMTIFVIYEWQQERLNKLWVYFELMCGILITCQIIPFFAYILIRNETSAVIWTTELMRNSRFLVVPLFALIAILLHSIEKKFVLSWQMVGIALMVIASFGEWFLILPLGILWALKVFVKQVSQGRLFVLWCSAWASISTLILMRSLFSVHITYALIVAIIVGLATLIVMVGTRSQFTFRHYAFILLSVPLIVFAITIFTRQNPTSNHKIFAEQVLFSGIFGLALAIIVAMVWYAPNLSFKKLLPIFASIVVIQTGLGMWYSRYHFIAPDIPPHIEAARWAIQNTPQNTLFFTATQGYYGSEFAMEFRLYSLRSISQNLSESNLYLYSRPENVPIFDQRHAEQFASYKTADSLVAMAYKYSANYILIDRTFLGYELNLPVAFAKDNFIIYRLDDSN